MLFNYNPVQRRSEIANARGGIYVSAVISLVLLLLTVPAVAGEMSEKSYDKFFREFTTRYFGNKLDWRLFKAQGIVESRLIHNVRSKRGARGVMQVMPVTYKEIQKKNPIFRSRSLDSVSTNINAGLFYNYYLYNRWDVEVTPDNRIRLMLASYNGGFSRVLKAFDKAGEPENDWSAVAQFLPTETRQYVKRVMSRFKVEAEKPVKPATHKIFLTQAELSSPEASNVWEQAITLD